MHPSNSDRPELQSRLVDAVARIRTTPLDDTLVVRCRERALDIGLEDSKVELPSSSSRSEWGVPLTAAAMLLLAINLLQAYSRLPAADRQQAAIHVAPDGQSLVHFSDLRIEPASTSALTPKSKP